MHGPPAVTAALVTGSIVVALYCAASLAVRRRALARGPMAEANHVVMALAMVVMLVPATMDLVAPAIGLAAFAALALAWAAAGLSRRGSGSCASPWHLVLVNAAMATMYAAMLPTTPTGPIAATGAMPGMAGMEMPGMPGMAAGSTPPTVVVAASLALGIVVLVHAARSVGGALAGGESAAAVAGGGLVHRIAESPRAHLSCQALMSAVMAVALFLSL